MYLSEILVILNNFVILFIIYALMKYKQQISNNENKTAEKISRVRFYFRLNCRNIKDMSSVGFIL